MLPNNKNWLLWIIALFAFLMPLQAKEKPEKNSMDIDRSKLAFDGAEGFGAYSQGGRGGKVLTVTNLQDNGEQGSLRWAIEQNYPRIIQFAVEGTISLNDDLKISSPFITIDASVAPGGGITLIDGTLIVEDTHDVILRYLRVRPGDSVALKKGRWAHSNRKNAPKDSISIYNSQYVIVDHCSASWSSDECISATEESSNITIQWCFLTEPLANPKVHIENGKPIAHAYCSLLNGTYISSIKNLFAYYMRRGPQLSIGDQGETSTIKEAVSNYMYGYSEVGTAIHIAEGKLAYHIVNNYYEHPLDDKAKEMDLSYDDGGGAKKQPISKARIYVVGNYGPDRTSSNQDEWSLLESSLNSKDQDKIRSTNSLFSSFVETIPAKNVPYAILSYGGATLPRRDATDTRITNQILNKQGGLVQSQDEFK